MAMGSKNIIIKMKINKKLGAGIFVGVFILFLSSYVYAFGISSAYHKEHPLSLAPGETKDIAFTLQNLAGSQDVDVKANIIKGEGILELVGPTEVFTIPVGTKSGFIVRVTMPSNARVGDIYSVEVGANTVTQSESGTFGFGSSVGRQFDVIVASPTPEEVALPEEKPETKTSTIILAIAVIAVLIVLTILLIRRRRK